MTIERMGMTLAAVLLALGCGNAAPPPSTPDNAPPPDPAVSPAPAESGAAVPDEPAPEPEAIACTPRTQGRIEATAEQCTKHEEWLVGEGCLAKSLIADHRKCADGDADACELLGFLWSDGKTAMGQDRCRAALLFQRACESGRGKACGEIALAVAGGYGVERDPAAAAVWLGKACYLQYERACEQLAKVCEIKRAIDAGGPDEPAAETGNRFHEIARALDGDALCR